MARDLHINYVRIGCLSIAKALHEFIEQEAAPGTSLSAEAFWSGCAELLRECGARNHQLLQVRDELQSRIDQYHRERLLSAPVMSMMRSRLLPHPSSLCRSPVRDMR